jgi:hypothetical protein
MPGRKSYPSTLTKEKKMAKNDELCKKIQAYTHEPTPESALTVLNLLTQAPKKAFSYQNLFRECFWVIASQKDDVNMETIAHICEICVDRKTLLTLILSDCEVLQALQGNLTDGCKKVLISLASKTNDPKIAVFALQTSRSFGNVDMIVEAIQLNPLFYEDSFFAIEVQRLTETNPLVACVDQLVAQF